MASTLDKLLYAAFLVMCLIMSAVHGFFSASMRRFSGNSKLSMAVGAGEKVLIVQNKGGGHGSIGFELCKSILSDSPNAEVTMLQDKCKYDKVPFSMYTELEALGVKIVEAKLTGDTSSAAPIDALSGQSFDYIVDNWSKTEGNASFVIDIAKSGQTACKQLLFVSSAGMYNTRGIQPMVETDPVKSSNGAKQVETVVAASGLPFTFMRPQYIYGSTCGKKYLDFFFGRAHRKLPIPLPLHGEQLVCLSHIEDVASLIATSLGHPNAVNEIFNCGTDKYVTYKNLCTLVHETLNNDPKDAQYLFYEPKEFDHWKSKDDVMAIPFRRESFVISVDKAKISLDWAPKHSLKKDLQIEAQDYLASSRSSDAWDIKQLKYDMEVIASKDHTFTFTYPFLDDKEINTESRPYPFEASDAK